jgi:hypothetical protein
VSENSLSGSDVSAGSSEGSLNAKTRGRKGRKALKCFPARFAPRISGRELPAGSCSAEAELDLFCGLASLRLCADFQLNDPVLPREDSREMLPHISSLRSKK